MIKTSLIFSCCFSNTFSVWAISPTFRAPLIRLWRPTVQTHLTGREQHKGVFMKFNNIEFYEISWSQFFWLQSDKHNVCHSQRWAQQCSKHVEECNKCIEIKNSCIKVVKKTISVLGCTVNKTQKHNMCVFFFVGPHAYLQRSLTYILLHAKDRILFRFLRSSLMLCGGDW